MSRRLSRDQEAPPPAALEGPATDGGIGSGSISSAGTDWFSSFRGSGGTVGGQRVNGTETPGNGEPAAAGSRAAESAAAFGRLSLSPPLRRPVLLNDGGGVSGWGGSTDTPAPADATTGPPAGRTPGNAHGSSRPQQRAAAWPALVNDSSGSWMDDGSSGAQAAAHNLNGCQSSGPTNHRTSSGSSSGGAKASRGIAGPGGYLNRWSAGGNVGGMNAAAAATAAAVTPVRTPPSAIPKGLDEPQSGAGSGGGGVQKVAAPGFFPQPSRPVPVSSISEPPQPPQPPEPPSTVARTFGSSGGSGGNDGGCGRRASAAATTTERAASKPDHAAGGSSAADAVPNGSGGVGDGSTKQAPALGGTTPSRMSRRLVDRTAPSSSSSGQGVGPFSRGAVGLQPVAEL